MEEMEEFVINVDEQIYSVIPMGGGTDGVFQVLAGDTTERYIQKDENGHWREIHPHTKLPLRDEYENHIDDLGRKIESHYD